MYRVRAMHASITIFTVPWAFIYNILALLMSVCACVFFCVFVRLRDGRDSGALILRCVGVSQFMQQHLRVFENADSLGLEIIQRDEMLANTEMYLHLYSRLFGV